MSALPITAAPPATAESSFRSDLAALEQRYVELWNDTTAEPPILGPPRSRWRRFTSARAARELVDRLAREVENHPEREVSRNAWRQRIEEAVRSFGEQRMGWPAGYRRLLFADAYYEASVAFSRQARDFDPDLETAEIGQAIRNVWIMNSLQMLLERPVEISPAIFAYSMLYPETDNYLDDPAVTTEDKHDFNERLGRRLRGEPVPGCDPRQSRVFRLVGMIEGQWSRTAYPEVYASLLAIHRGQIRSLEQDDPAIRHDQDRLLRLSVAKGGASVLADGYLTAGSLTAGEADFCFGYGVFLQLLDDLQDLATDRDSGHATLFSTAERGAALDRLASRVYHFMHEVVAGSPRFAPPRYRDCRDLILRNCTLLLVGAVADHRKAFTRGFRRRIERSWPLGFTAMRRLRRRARRRFDHALRDLRQRRGVESVFDLL